MSKWDLEQMKKELDDYFENVSREQLIKDLKEAGFEVEDGSGKVIFTEYTSTNELLDRWKEIQRYFQKADKLTGEVMNMNKPIIDKDSWWQEQRYPADKDSWWKK